jgi:hypothetical protein
MSPQRLPDEERWPEPQRFDDEPGVGHVPRA